MKHKVLVLFAVLASAVGAVVLYSGGVLAFNNFLPDPNDTSGNGNIRLINANTRYVQETNGVVRVWFPNNNGGDVEIRGGNFCSGVGGDRVETEDGSYNQWGNGDNITLFRGQNGQEFMGRKGQNCAGTFRFNFRNIAPRHQQNGYYYQDIVITYRGGHQNPFSGAINAFTIVAPGQPNVRIGLPARDDTRATGFETTQGQIGSSPTYTQYNVRFGAPCELTSSEIVRVYMYDLDNAGGSGAQVGRNVTVVLRNLRTGALINFTGSSHSGNPGTVWRPADRQNDTQWVSFRASPNEKYQLQIRDVYFNNTIQYSIPYAQIYSEACPSAQVVPHATVNGSTSNVTRPLGSQITFRNWATTSGVDSAGNDTFQLSAVVTQRPIPGGAYGPTTQRLAPARDVPDNRRALTFTPTTPGTYCLETRVRSYPPYVTTPQGINRQICATITAPPPPVATNRQVIIRPVADDGPDIEPTETTTINGRVIVENFPTYTSWGYTEYSSQANPNSVPASQSPYSSSNSYAGRDSASRGGCASRDRRGNCVSWYWYCGGSYAGTGSRAPTCPAKYRHTCRTTSWVDYNSSGTCYDRWVCPSPNGRTYYQSSAPNCNVWRCPYAGAPAYSSTRPSRADCEYRCNSGTGSVAYNGSGSYASPCYQRPQFTMTCEWVGGNTMTVTVTGNGTYCQSSEQHVGMIVGQRVCSYMTADMPAYPNAWRPNPPLPGYGNGGSNPNASYSQRERWGWTITPRQDEGCARVVAKPTFKVFGGDVSVGARFDNPCSTAPVSATIAGWPNEPDFNASYTQYGAYATNQIYGFATAAIRSNFDTQPPRDLAFANTSGGGFGDYYGGGYSRVLCIPDHSSRPPGVSSTSSLTSSTVDGSYEYTSSVINNNPRLNPGQQIVLYRQGNLHIASNITYNRAAPWPTLADIPALKIVVVGGNITIDPGVTELNGVYVAQPRNGVGGNIYTCGQSNGTSVTNSQLYNQCRTKLTVNGAFVADRVHLGRTGGGVGSQGGTAIRGETSEEFNYLPEVWLAPWPRDNTTIHTKFDAMTNLPPVL